MGKNRLELRRMAEAAENRKTATGTKKATAKKATKTKAKAKRSTTSRRKTAVVEKKRVVWCVYNGSMKEEARFPYDQRAAAEEKMEALKLKSTKKLYFIQAVKEPLPDAAPAEEEEPEAEE